MASTGSLLDCVPITRSCAPRFVVQAFIDQSGARAPGASFAPLMVQKRLRRFLAQKFVTIAW